MSGQIEEASELEQAITGWEKLMADMPGILMRLLVAGLLVIVGIAVLRLGRKMIRRAQQRAERGRDPSAPRQTIHSLVLSLFNYLMYFAIAMAALSALGVDVSSILAVAGVSGVAIGFGCQSLVKDFVSGLFLWVEGRINVGDMVTVGNQTGIVENMALRTTTLRGTNGNLFTIPNGDIRTVINMSRDYRCALVDVTVAHGQDKDYAQLISLLQNAMKELDERLEELEEPPQVLGVVNSDGRAATFRIECRCKVEDGWALEREIRLAALQCLKKEGLKP
ncbi:MAG: mechanosensitive ion channel family protein [Clostridiales bacterium]|nr:mechanosensitive ion channel family protein [Clostridiales bacterium]